MLRTGNQNSLPRGASCRHWAACPAVWSYASIVRPWQQSKRRGRRERSTIDSRQWLCCESQTRIARRPQQWAAAPPTALYRSSSARVSSQIDETELASHRVCETLIATTLSGPHNAVQILPSEPPTFTKHRHCHHLTSHSMPPLLRTWRCVCWLLNRKKKHYLYTIL